MSDIDLSALRPPFLIHSDIFKAFSFVRRRAAPGQPRPDVNQLHLDWLASHFGRENLIFPSFNYDFPKTKLFDLQQTPSQVGQLTNYVLRQAGFQRTATPIFSFLTMSPELCRQTAEPFSRGSIFDALFQKDGTVVFYGAEISSCTYLHFVESQFGAPLYRYDKSFSGVVVDGGIAREAAVTFHARPLGLDLEYDWDHLYRLLERAGAVKRFAANGFAVKAAALSEVWGEAFIKAPLDFLEPRSRVALRALVDKLGRRLTIEDCEGQP